jgi:hypothetical protein
MFLEYTESVDTFPTDALFYIIDVSPHVVYKTAIFTLMPSGLSDTMKFKLTWLFERYHSVISQQQHIFTFILKVLAHL